MPRGHFQDHTGCIYGRLTVLEHLGYGRWLCKCECGNTTVKRGSLLSSGKALSCGCLAQEKAIERSQNAWSLERLYAVWQGMKSRCYNKNNSSYTNYGGRGIKVCDEWLHDYPKFREWAFATGYDPNASHGECTLDRINVDGDYCPSNCRWVDWIIQANNKHHPSKHLLANKPVRLLNSDGKELRVFHSMTEASKVTGCGISSISAVLAGKKEYAGNARYSFQLVDIDGMKKRKPQRYGTDKQYRQLADSIDGKGCVINDRIVYPNTATKVRLGDLVRFVSVDNYPIVDTGAVIGAGYGGWEPIDPSHQKDVTLSVVLLDGHITAIPIDACQRI